MKIFFPREWECTLVDRDDLERLTLFPTHVGVYLHLSNYYFEV